MGRNRKLIVGIIALVVVTSIISFAVSAVVFLNWRGINPGYDITFNPKTVKVENIRKYNQVRNILKKDYYQEIDENQMLEGAITGMADSLKDPYTVYFNKEQMQLFMEKSEGSYSGIGVSITVDTDGLLSIVELFNGSPARDAGMMKDDKIIKVNDKDVTAIKDENIVIKMIRGEENTKVKVTIYRPSAGKSIDFDLVRKVIKIDNIQSRVISDEIGYIRIVMFDGTIAASFMQSLNNLLASGVKGIIIDLRDDPGGSYEQVIAIADRILPKGLIVFTKDKNGKKSSHYSDDTELKLPIAVLINGNSASASEILAGAIKDHKKGTMVGTKSFGKGLVQEVRQLDDGSGLKVTVARYYTPSGVCIQGIGIEPDIKVELSEKFKNLPVSQLQQKDDEQLKAAIEVINRQIK